MKAGDIVWLTCSITSAGVPVTGLTTSTISITGRQNNAAVTGLALVVSEIGAGVYDLRATVPPAALANRPVVAKLAPPPPAVPFEAQRQLLQQHPGVPVVSDQLRNLRTQAPAQSPVPARMQVQALDTRQVLPITPAVRVSPAPAFAQRPAQPRSAPQQMPVQSPLNRPVPAAAPQNVPSMQGRPPVSAQPVPMVREQVRPAAPGTPAMREPPVREQVRPSERVVPAPVIQQRIEPQVRPQAAPPRPQPQHEPPPSAPKAAPPRPAREEDKKREEKK